MSRKLYVGNLPYRTDENELQELFGQFGAVESVRVMRDLVEPARDVVVQSVRHLPHGQVAYAFKAYSSTIRWLLKKEPFSAIA